MRSVLCEVLCARSCAHVLCARLVRIPKCLRASNVLCAVLCGCCARLVRSVRRRLWVWDIFSGGLVRVLCWGLGRKIPPPWAPNTLYLDKVLCVSCAPGAFAKKNLGNLVRKLLWWILGSGKHSIHFRLQYIFANTLYPNLLQQLTYFMPMTKIQKKKNALIIIYFQRPPTSCPDLRRSGHEVGGR